MPNKKLIEYWENAKEYIKRRLERGKPELPTGIEFIDDLTDGIHRGEVWCISGRSGVGKTALAMQIARNISDDTSKSILFISLEMQGEELVSRMFCEMMEVDFHALRQGNYPDNWEEKNKVFNTFIKGIDFEIFEYGYTYKEIEEIIKKYYTQAKKPDVIFIDFVQLIAFGGAQEERLAIAEFTRKLTELAKKENMAIVLVSQIRRLPSGADVNRPPDITDLFGSSKLEQLSHIVIFVYKKIEKGNGGEKVMYMIKVAKNRHGRTGEKEVTFVGENYKFKDEIIYQKDYYENY